MLSEYEKNVRKNTKTKRNQKIVDLYTSGEYSIRDIANRPDIHISPQRVHAILKRAGVDGSLIEKERHRKKKVKRECKGCGKIFWVRPSRADQKYHNQQCFIENNKNYKYTDEDLEEHLKMIRHKHGALSVKAINKEGPPTYTTLYQRIGGIEDMRSFLDTGV